MIAPSFEECEGFEGFEGRVERTSKWRLRGLKRPVKGGWMTDND
jgi:hypothetical protein